MKTVNMHEAKTHLSRLVEQAAAGEEIVIARAGKPLVRLVAVTTSVGPRQLGALAGKVVEADDAWATDPDLEAAFYGAEVVPPRGMRVAEHATERVSGRVAEPQASSARATVAKKKKKK